MAMTINHAAATNIAVGALKPSIAAAKNELAQRNDGPAGAESEHATAGTFENRVLRATVPVLVDFHADWCEPCQIQGRILKEFTGEFAGGRIVKVDVDENPGLAARYDVRALPTLLVFREGHVVARQVGVATKQQLKALLAG